MFNIAQVYEMKDNVSLLTFDADDTIYEHGMDLDSGSWIVNALCALMECGTLPCACSRTEIRVNVTMLTFLADR